VDESKDVKFAFYYENNVLKRKWESKDGYKRGNQIVLPKSLRKAVLEFSSLTYSISISSWISSSGSEKSIRSTSSFKSWECTSHSTISFSISSFCRITLYTAVGQPFTAKMAVLNLDTPYFKGHATVGLVANITADALLGMDILGKSKTYVVTRSKHLSTGILYK
jgi:hypothetical protein